MDAQKREIKIQDIAKETLKGIDDEVVRQIDHEPRKNGYHRIGSSIYTSVLHQS